MVRVGTLVRRYAAAAPATAVGLLAKLGLPTGAYSGDKVFNLGTNRWSLQLGPNISIPLAGKSRISPDYTTFDLLPTVTFFRAIDGRTHGASSKILPS